MRFSLVHVVSLASLGQTSPFEIGNPRLLTPRAACDGNTASTRNQWCDFDINTDYYNTVPDTGVTREYWLELGDVTVSPDGVPRYAQAFNGSIPGPTLIADWGDTVVVHLTNALTASTNGTSIHFHGIRQNFTNQQDGVISITQCPVAPGESITYTWRATQYGSTWYHSHFSLQAWEGVFGGIVINGPATDNYDEDLGHIFLTDWSHQSVDELWIAAETQGPPTMDNGLLNGTNVYGEDGASDQTGSRLSVKFTENSSYRIRLVSSAIDTHWKFSIDNHTMKVIAADLVPIKPYETTVLGIGMGQRYDIIVTADQASVASDFWMRAVPQSACSDNDSSDNIKGIVFYGDSPGIPTTTGYDFVDGCEDEDGDDLVPYLPKTVDASVYEAIETVTVGINSNNVFKWYLNSTTLLVDWAEPTLLQVYNNETTFEIDDAVIELSDADEWAYVIIETALAIPHPVHLHGFDFYVLAQGSGAYSAATPLKVNNPMRRDVAMLPASGHLVLAFQTDNPGAWLMHCHIGWHTSEGFALQFLVRQDEIGGLIKSETLTGTCAAWNEHARTHSVVLEDSGI